MRKYILFLLIPFFVFGCMSMSAGTKIDENLLSKIENCKTTKSEILELFGEPWRTGFQNGYKTMNWQYASFEGSQNYFVFLNKEGIIVDQAMNPVGLVQINDTCKK